ALAEGAARAPSGAVPRQQARHGSLFTDCPRDEGDCDHSAAERRAARTGPARRNRGPAPTSRGKAGAARRRADPGRGARPGRAGRRDRADQGRRHREVRAPGRRRARRPGDGAPGDRPEPQAAGARTSPGGGTVGRVRGSDQPHQPHRVVTEEQAGRAGAPDLTGPAAPTRPALTVLSGPTAVGKGTVVGRLRETPPEVFVSVSATTRPARPGEVDGARYLFVDAREFDRLTECG